jgi:hypothetical protein
MDAEAEDLGGISSVMDAAMEELMAMQPIIGEVAPLTATVGEGVFWGGAGGGSQLKLQPKRQRRVAQDMAELHGMEGGVGVAVENGDDDDASAAAPHRGGALPATAVPPASPASTCPPVGGMTPSLLKGSTMGPAGVPSRLRVTIKSRTPSVAAGLGDASGSGGGAAPQEDVEPSQENSLVAERGGAMPPVDSVEPFLGAAQQLHHQHQLPLSYPPLFLPPTTSPAAVVTASTSSALVEDAAQLPSSSALLGTSLDRADAAVLAPMENHSHDHHHHHHPQEDSLVVEDDLLLMHPPPHQTHSALPEPSPPPPELPLDISSPTVAAAGAGGGGVSLRLTFKLRVSTRSVGCMDKPISLKKLCLEDLSTSPCPILPQQE